MRLLPIHISLLLNESFCAENQEEGIKGTANCR